MTLQLKESEESSKALMQELEDLKAEIVALREEASRPQSRKLKGVQVLESLEGVRE